MCGLCGERKGATMMKHSSMFNECERFLKRVLKDKGLFSKGAVIAYLITGGIGFVAPVLWGDSVYGATTIYTVQSDSYTGGTRTDDGNNKKYLTAGYVQRGNSVILAPTNADYDWSKHELYGIDLKDGESEGVQKFANTIVHAAEFNRDAKESVILGYAAVGQGRAYGQGYFTAIGSRSRVFGSQGTAVGNASLASDQATAVGSDVYATGSSSIAIGSDDISSKYTDKLTDAMIKEIYGDGDASTDAEKKLFAARDLYSSGIQDKAHRKDAVVNWDKFKYSYLGNNAIYNPTFAGGSGAIAIGSRSIASEDGSTAIGTLSYALARGATAMGLRAFTSREAEGSVAIGEESRTFAKQSLSVGNHNEATQIGAMSYGYNAKAVGKGSLAFGYNAFANAFIDNDAAYKNKHPGENSAPVSNIIKTNVLAQNQDISESNALLIRAHLEKIQLYKEAQNKAVSASYTQTQKDTDVRIAKENMVASEKEVKKINLTSTNELSLIKAGFLAGQSSHEVTKRITALVKGVTNQDKYGNITSNKFSLDVNKDKEYMTITRKDDKGNDVKDTIYKTRSTGDNAIAIGYYTNASGNSSIAQGSGSYVEADSGIGIGSLTYVDAKAANSIAIGVGAQVRKENSIAFGTQSGVYGAGSMGLGPGARVIGDNSVAFGYGSIVKANAAMGLGVGSRIEFGATNSMSIGNNSMVGENANSSIAFGEGSNVTASSAVALGRGASADFDNSVALGYRSNTFYYGNPNTREASVTSTINDPKDTAHYNKNKATNVHGLDIAPYLPDSAGKGIKEKLAHLNTAAAGYVSVGGWDASVDENGKALNNNAQLRGLRRIVNVAPGALDTDAVTVAQLREWTDKSAHFLSLAGAENKSAADFKKEIAPDGSTEVSSNFDNDGASGEYALALGVYARGAGAGSISIGRSSFGQGTNSTTLGSYGWGRGTEATSIGYRAYSYGEQSVALGTRTVTDSDYGVAIGNRARSWSAGNNGHSGIAIGSKATANYWNALALGTDSKVRGWHSTAIGANAQVGMPEVFDDNGVSMNVFNSDGKSLNKANQVVYEKTGETNTEYTVKEYTPGTTTVTRTFTIQKPSTIHNALAFGHDASVTNDRVTDAKDSTRVNEFSSAGSIAIGASASVKGSQNSVALGLNSKVVRTDTETNSTAAFTGDTNNDPGNGVVSIGTIRNTSDGRGVTRRIVGVAGGQDDFDAVNVKQLKTAVKYYKTNTSDTANRTVNNIAGVSANYNGEGATGTASVTLGSYTKASGDYSTAIGRDVITSGSTAVGIGTNVSAFGDSSVVLGNDAIAGYTKTEDSKTVPVGATEGVAIGKGAKVESQYTVAIGGSAQVVRDTSVATAIKDADSSVAIGASAKVIGAKYSVALGIDSKVVNSDTTATTAAFTGETNDDPNRGVLSIGDTDKNRRIIHVAGGSGDYDAVNVKQLKAVAVKYYKTNSTETANRTVNGIADVSANYNGEGATGTASVAVGSYTQASGNYSTAIGRDVITSGKTAVGLGTNVTASGEGSVGMGFESNATADNAIAIGRSVTTSGANGIAIGRQAYNNSADSIVLGTGATVGTAASGTAAAISANNSVAIGKSATVKSGQGSVALGWNSEVTDDDVKYHPTTAGKTKASPYLLNEDVDKMKDADNGVVSIGRKRTSNDGSSLARRIVGVAGGYNDYDAVNVKQLKAAAWGLQVQNGTATKDVTPVGTGDLRKITLKAGNNVTLDNNNGVVTINASGGLNSITSSDENVLGVSTTAGAVTLTPKVATTITGDGDDANKLVTSGVVNTAIGNIPITSFKADAGGATANTEGTFTPTASKKEINITGAGKNGDEKQTWTQGSKRFYSDNIGTHLNSDGRVLVGLNDELSVKNITTYKYGTDGKRTDNKGVSLTTDGLVGNGTDALTISNGDYAKITVNKGTSTTAKGSISVNGSKLTGLAEGTIGAGSTDAVTGDQLNSKLAEKANVSDLTGKLDKTAELHVRKGDYTVGDNGEVSLIQEDADGTKNDSKAFKIKNIATKGSVDTLTGKVDTNTTNIANLTTAVDKAITFKGNDGQGVAKKLGEVLSITGEGTVPTGTNTAANNIKTTKLADGSGLQIGLADTLTKMKGISGNGTDPLTIKNGDTTITVTPSKPQAGTNPAVPSTVNFGGAKLTTTFEAANDADVTNKKYVDNAIKAVNQTAAGNANLGYKANNEALKSVAVATGLTFKSGTGTIAPTGLAVGETSATAATDNVATKTGIKITTEANGIVNIGLDEATRKAIDNAANKDLGNLSDTGKGEVKKLANEAVKFGDGKNTKVNSSTASNVTTYKIDAYDTKLTGTTEVTVGAGDTADANNVRNYTIGLSQDTKETLAKVAILETAIGKNGADGRDGKPGIASGTTAAGVGAQGPTGKDGLNGKDLTAKVNALRNGEAGTVVYTDDQGNRVVKANDGKWYDARVVDDKGALKEDTAIPADVSKEEVTTPQARLVNPDGTTVAGTDNKAVTKLSNIADGEIAANSHDAVTGGQLHTVKQAVETNAQNISSLTTKVTTNTNDIAGLKTTVGKAITFTGDDNQGVERKLDTTLTVKGAKNFTPGTGATAGVNIRVEKDATEDANGLVLKLADTLTDMKGITAKEALTISSGGADADVAKMTFNPKKTTGGTTTEANISVNNVKLTGLADAELSTSSTDAVTGKQLYATNMNVTNLTNTVDQNTTNITNLTKTVNQNANLGYKAGDEATSKTVAVTTGLTFKAGTGTVNATGTGSTTTNGEATKKGIAISTAANGVVNIGLDADTRSAIDNAANKDLGNLSTTGTNKITDLAKAAAKEVVKVGAGVNTTVETDTTTTAGSVIYKVNAFDTHVAGTANEIEVNAATVGTDKVRKYTLGLSTAIKNKISTIDTLEKAIGTNGADGRDGKPGTGADAGMGAQGPTGKDGLNGTDLTTKVNALRNGEAGTVVYTDAQGNRVVKANDGKWYDARVVDDKGALKEDTAIPADVSKAEVTTPQARLVNPDGTTTITGTSTGTKLTNIADGTIAAGSHDAVTGGQLHTVKQDVATNAQNINTNTQNINSLTTKVTTNTSDIAGLKTTVGKAITFTGDTGANAVRKLDSTLAVKGGENFTPATGATPGVNIQVDSNDANGLTVKLADTLTKMKGISGTGTSDLVIKNGDHTTITIKPGTAAPASGGNATPGTVDFGKSTLTNVGEAKNDNDVTNKKYVDEKVAGLNLGYKAESEAGKTVAVTTGLTFKAGTGTIAPTGLAAGTTSPTSATDNVATKTGIKITTEANGVVNIGLDEATRKVIDKAAKLGDTAVDGRDGKAANGKTGTAGNAGDHGLTGADGMNGKDLTSKVNALRNGEAGTVVYTDKDGNRLVKANDGKYYKADQVDKDGKVITPASGTAPTAATPVEARLVNPDGTTTIATGTTGTKLSNIADGAITATSKDAVNGSQLRTAKSEIGAIIGGTTINGDGKITGPTFTITKADGTNETTSTIKDAIDKLNTTNVDQNTKISSLTSTVDKAITFVGDDDTNDKIARKLGDTLNIKGQNNITVTKAAGTDNTLNVSLSSTLKNITSISSGEGTGKPGTTLTLGANELKITNTQAPATGATAGVTKTVTIGKDGIDAGSMKITNVAKATNDGDATNKEYVDEAIRKVNNTVAGNATLNFAGNETKDAANKDTDKVGLALSTGVLKVKGDATANDIVTTAKGDTITIGLHKNVTDQLAKLGNTASDGRDGKSGTATGANAGMGAQGPTGKDGLNGKTITEKVNALRNGEAGTVVYTDDQGNRLVKANDGKYYKADDVKADGTVKTATEAGTTEAPQPVANPQARLVNPDGTTVAGTDTKAVTKLSNIAEGAITSKSNDAVTGRQLHTAKQELATALGGDAAVNTDGTLKAPTYKITNDGAATPHSVDNVGAAVEKLDARITTARNYTDTTVGVAKAALTADGMDFKGDDGNKVHRDLGTELTIKGGANFTPTGTTPATTPGVNIRVVKDATSGANGLTVHLADTLTNMKGISGTGTDNLVIKNGETKITINQGTPATGSGTATPGTVDFGKSTLTNVGEAKNDDDVTNKKYVDNKVAGLNLGYKAESETGKSVAVTTGLTFKAGTGTTGTSATGTDAMATKTGIAISTEENGVVNIGLDEATRKVIDKAAKLGDTAVDGRDGKAANGKTGAAGNAGDHGLTGKDGLNGTDLTTKVNALRNGEAGTVVYTDKDGNRLVKANDGNYYKADQVNKDGNVITPASGTAPTPATPVEARLVNPDGTTTIATGSTGTKLSNIADGAVTATSKDAVNGSQLRTAKSEIGDIIGGTTIDTDGKITGPTFTIAKADGSTENATTIKGAIEKLNTTNVDQNTKITNLMDGKISFVGDTATDKVERKLGETLNIKGQNNISVTKATGTIDTLNVSLASDLKNITSITNADADNKPGTKIQLGADNVTITNTQAPATGATKGETKTVTIGKDGINAGSMKITNVAKATDKGDAANKEYVDDAINSLNTKVTNNANLRYAGDTNVGAATGEDHLNLALATGTLKVAGTADQIKTEAENGTITVSLHETVTKQLDKLGNTAADGRDGKPGIASGTTTAGIGAQGPTGKDGLNGKTITEKVNALRNGEAGTVVYTDENGERVVRASDGKFYNVNEVKADGAVKTKAENGGKEPTEVITIQARLVNPDGTTVAGADNQALTKLSNIAEGAITATSNDAVTGRQLHTAKQELATALGGNAAVDANGTWTPPTYTITKDGTTAGTDTVNNVGDAVSKLDTRINTLKGNPLTFTGDDNQGVTRTLGETLTVKGGANVDTTATTMTNGVNIRVVKDATSGANGLTVHLADTLTNMKGISGNGTNDLVIKNGTNEITIKPGKPATGTTKADPGTVNFGDATVTVKNLDASISYKANSETAKTVKLQTGLNFIEGDGTAATNVDAKSGLKIATGTDGKVIFGLNDATRTILDKAAKIGDTASDGRDGKTADGTGGAAGDKGVTGKDGLNGKDLTTKVNALRNGEAGTVVYTDDKGNRLVKTNDGKWYPATAVDDNGTLKPVPTGGTAPVEVKPKDVVASLVSPDGTTTNATTVLNNVGSALASIQKDAATKAEDTNYLDKLAKATDGTSKVANSVVNVTDLKKTADAIIDKGLTFKGNDGTDIPKALGSTLSIVGEGDYGTPTVAPATAAKNIFTKHVTENNVTRLEIGLAKDLVGITSIANETDTTKPITKVDIGNDGITVTNTQPVPAGAAAGTQPVVTKTTIGKEGVKVGDTVTLDKAGMSGNGTDSLTITNGANTKITVSPSTATDTKGTVDFGGARITNIAVPTDDKDAVNKAYVDGKIGNVAEIGYKANTETTTKKVAVGTGLHFMSGTGTVAPANLPAGTTSPTVSTDTKAAKKGIVISTEAGGIVNIGLDADTRKVIDNAAKLGDTSVDGRDGKPGTGTDAGMGAKGPTGKDGLNGTDLTTKVNALRNGEAGTVVYTNTAGERLVKADDGKFYKADDVDEHGKVKTPAAGDPAPVGLTADKVIASLVSPDGTTAPNATDTAKKAMTKLSNIAEGAITSTSNDAVTGRQIHEERKALATALGGNAAVADDGTWTAPTYKITDDANAATPHSVNNVGAAVEKLNARITTARTYTDTTVGAAKAALTADGMDFKGDDGNKVHRNLKEELTIKGGANFDPTATATKADAGVNIRVDKDSDAGANGLKVHLADTLTNMKGISGNGTNDLVIKNGDHTTITIKPGTAAPATGGNATPGTVDFGGSTITNIGAPSAGSDAVNKTYVDNKIGEVADIGYKANAETTTNKVAVGTGLHFKSGTGTVAPANLPAGTVSPTASTDTKAAKKGIVISTEAGGIVNIGLDADTRKVIDNAAKLGDTAVDGRDGKSGTGTDAGMGAKGPTGADGLNGKTITEKVNALRNGEAGTVVYTDKDGNRLVKANDGKYYKADQVDKDGKVITPAGGTAPTPTTPVEARLVNPDGTTTPNATDATKAAVTKLSNIAEGAITSTSNDAVTGRQIHGERKALATALGGNAAVADDGTWTAPTYTITNDGGTNHTVHSVGDAVTKLDTRITDARAYTDTKVAAATTSGMNFAGDDNASVHRNLGATLTVKGGQNFDPTATATKADAGVNIRVEKDSTAGTNGLTVKLADTLTNMKGISGNGTDNLVIKNGTNTITITPGKAAAGKTPADPGKVDFGDATVTVKNLDASITYRANGATDADAKTVKLKQGLDFVAGTGTIGNATTGTDVETTKKGITITTGENGKVYFGLDADTRKTIDNAAKIGNTASDGRDGKTADGTGVAAGDKGVTGKDGLNGKDLTNKVNALRNGEAGTVVYTDADGNRLVKANDGKYYKANEVKDDGTVKTAAELGVPDAPKAVDNPQARVVNSNGETTAPIAFGNIASSILNVDAKDDNNVAITNPQFLDRLKTAAKTNGAKHAAVNVTDLYSTANDIVTNGLDFYGNDVTDAGKVHRNIGTALKVQGADNFARGTTDTNNIKVERKATADGFDVKLAENLTKMKEVAGNDTDTLVLRNGKDDATHTKVEVGTNKFSVTNSTSTPATTPGTAPTVTTGKLEMDADGTTTFTNSGAPANAVAINSKNGTVTVGNDVAGQPANTNKVVVNGSNATITAGTGTNAITTNGSNATLTVGGDGTTNHANHVSINGTTGTITTGNTTVNGSSVSVIAGTKSVVTTESGTTITNGTVTTTATAGKTEYKDGNNVTTVNTAGMTVTDGTNNATYSAGEATLTKGTNTATHTATGSTYEDGTGKSVETTASGITAVDGTDTASYTASGSTFTDADGTAMHTAAGTTFTNADHTVTHTANGSTFEHGTNVGTYTAGGATLVDGTTSATHTAGVSTYTDGTNTVAVGTAGITITPSAAGGATSSVSLTTAGLNNGGNVIANVAAGTVDTDAVNLKQLKAGKTTFSVNDKDGATTNHNLVLTTTTDAKDGHTHYDVKLADKVTLGTAANAVTVDGTNGSITAGKDDNAVTVDGTKASITAGKDDKAVTVDGTKASITAGKDDKAVTVDGTKASITAGKDDKAVTVDGTKASITAGKDDKAVTVDGTKASITAGKDDKAVTVDGTKASITAGKDDKAVTVDGTKASIIAGKDDKAVTVDGTKASITAGKDDKAVTVDGTKASITAGTGANAITADGAKATLVVGGTGATTDSANKVTINGTDGIIKTGKTAVSGSAVTITDATSDAKKTIVDATGTTVTDGVANGKKVVTTAESVTVADGTTKTTTKAGETKYESNGKDLTVKTEGITVTDGNNTGSINAMNSTFTNATNGTQVGATLIRVNGDNNAGAITNGISIGKQSVTTTDIGEAPNTTTKTETGNFITGLDNKTWDPKTNGIVSGRAATEDQLKVVDDKVNKGRVFSADTLDANKKPVEAMVGLGDTLSIKGGADMKALTDNNIGVELKAAETKDGVTTPATMTVKLAKDVKMADGSTTYNTYLAEYERNADGSLKLEYDRNPDGTVNKNSVHSIIAKNADGSTKYQTDAEGNKIAVRTVTHNGDATYYTLHEVDKKGHLMTDAKGNPLTNVETGIGANGIEIVSGPHHNKPSVTLTSNGLNNGGNRITNVAPGVEATDAVNVGQVNSITTVLDRRINQTGAKAAAMAAMKPLMYDPLKKSQIMAGFGAQKGAQALALGVAHYFNEDVMVNMGLSVGAGDNMMNAGVTYRFGGSDSMIPERYKGGPISSIYVMQDEISALKAENEQVKSENAQIKADNSQVRADNERMKASYEKIMEDNAQMKQDNEEMKAQIKMLMAHMGIKA